MKKRERWFPIGSHSMPCAYWNVGGRGRGSAGSVWSDDVKESGLNLIPEKLFKNRALLDRDAQEGLFRNNNKKKQEQDAPCKTVYATRLESSSNNCEFSPRGRRERKGRPRAHFPY